MNMEKKIFICFLFAALLITAGCRKDDTPAEVKTPVGFRAMSQAVLTKAGEEQGRNPLSAYGISTFGVWGIARNDLNIQYLWNRPAADNTVQLVAVTKGTDDTDETYVPTEDAYWFSNSTHDFLALASKDPGTSNTFGTTGLSVTHTNATTGAQSDPVMTFTYDMSSKYNSGVYAYDLLGAAAHTEVEKVIPASQDLLFWHLFSKIVINITFVDNDNNPITGNNAPILKKMRLCNVNTKADYALSAAASNSISLIPDLSKYTNPEDKTNYVAPLNLEFTSSHQEVHIIPQNIQNFKLYVDFSMTTADGVTDFEDFEINLFPKSNTPKEYAYNNQYNWNITISPKLSVGFTVTVEDWIPTPVKDSNNKDEFEII